MQIIKHIIDASERSKKNVTRPIRIAERILWATIAVERAITVVTTSPIPPVKSAFLFLQKHFLLIHTGVKSAAAKVETRVNIPTPKATQSAIVKFVITPKKNKRLAAIANKIPAVTPASKQLIQTSDLSLTSQPYSLL